MPSIRHFIAPGLLAAAATAHADTSLNAAIVRLDAEGHHYLYALQKIKPGDDVYFQTATGDALPACCAKRSWKSATPLATDPVAIDFDSAEKLYRYRLADRNAAKDAKPFVGIAAVGKNLVASPGENGTVKVSGGDTTEELVVCTSPEGAHLVGHAGGKATAHLYLYLGVVIEHPTCPADIAK